MYPFGGPSICQLLSCIFDFRIFFNENNVNLCFIQLNIMGLESPRSINTKLFTLYGIFNRYLDVNNVSTYLFFHRDFHAVISRAHAQWRSKWRISLILNRTTTKLVIGITMQTVGCLIRKLVKGLIKTYISIIQTKFICDIFYLDPPSVTLRR